MASLRIYDRNDQVLTLAHNFTYSGGAMDKKDITVTLDSPIARTLRPGYYLGSTE